MLVKKEGTLQAIREVLGKEVLEVYYGLKKFLEDEYGAIEVHSEIGEEDKVKFLNLFIDKPFETNCKILIYPDGSIGFEG